MPASYDEYFEAFASLTGTSGEGSTAYDHNVAGVEAWVDLFESTGIDFASHEQQIDAFENFLIAYYPTEGDRTSGDEWFYIREEFKEQYGLSDGDLDRDFWEAYRHAIGYLLWPRQAYSLV